MEEFEGIGDLPDANYTVRIDSAVINHSKGSGRLQCSFELTVCEGEYAGRKLFKHDGIDGAQSLSYMRTNLARLGVEWPASPDDLPDTLEDLCGTFAAVTAKTKDNGIQNVYFNKALDSVVDESGSNPNLDDLDAEGGEDGGGEFAENDRVVVSYDDGDYEGVIINIDEDEGTALVQFDDDSEEDIDLADLKLAGDDAEDDTDKGEDEGEETDGGGISLTFDDDAIGASHEKRVTAAAEKCEYNPDDYETWAGLLTDLLEYVGAEGEFSKPLDAIKALEASLD